MKNCSIPLFSGLGNIIQSLPFVFEMKKKYNMVTAFNKSPDYPEETKQLTEKIFDKFFINKDAVPDDYIIFRHAIRRSYSEYKAWFVDNKQSLPEKFLIESIGYKKVSMQHRVIVWPETKSNWPCKMWDKWPELIKNFNDVGIVGLKKEPKFLNGNDYRGKLSLMEVGGLIKNADIFIGNEGGISHYAAALGIKTYIIYGCTDPIKNMPPNNAVMISKNLDCQPCQFRFLKQEGIKMIGCEDKKCLTELTVNEILEKIKCKK